jgi:hypothetical protein
MKNKFKISFAGIILVILVGWFYYAPYLAVNSLMTAAENNNAQTLAKHVDFPSLRESCKTWAKTSQFTKIAKYFKQDPLSGFGFVYTNSMIDHLVDDMISPAGIDSVFEFIIPNPGPEGHFTMPTGQKGIGPMDEAKGSHNSQDNFVVREGYTSFNEFVLSAKERNGKKEVALIFHRSGLSWKLAEMRPPPLSAFHLIWLRP